MLNRIKRFFDQHLEAKTEPASLEHRLHLAACALLLEVARMDEHVGDAELETIARACQRLLGLADDEVQDVVELAREEAKEATSLYQFTNLIHEHYTEDQKFALLRLMWEVALADNQVQALEEHMIRRVADLLYIPHARFTQARHLAEEARKQ